MYYTRLARDTEYTVYATIEVREHSGTLIKTIKEAEIDTTHVPEHETLASLAPEVYEALFGSKTGNYQIDQHGSDIALRQKDEDYVGELYLDLPNGEYVHAKIIARPNVDQSHDLGGDGWDD